MNEIAHQRGGRRIIRRPRLVARIAIPAMLTLGQILAAGPASAHGGDAAVAELSPLVRVARTVALTAAVLLAGAAFLRPLSGRPTELGRRVLSTAAAAGVVALAVALAGGMEPGPPVALLALLPAAAVAAVVAARPPAAVAAGAALVLTLCWDAVRDGPGPGALMIGHVAVAALWLGAILAGATAAAGARLALVRRLSPLAVGSAVALAGTGVLSARAYDLTLGGIATTTFGKVVLLKVGLLLVAGALGLATRRLALTRRAAGGGGAGVAGRVELAVTVAAVIAGVTLTSLPPPGPVAAAGVPLVRLITIGDAGTGLVVAPQRPGLNLVHLMTDRFTEVVVGGRSYEAAARPDTEGLWAEVDLPAGRSRLELRQGRHVAQQVLNAGAGPRQDMLAGPDGAECAAAALGAVLGGSRAPLRACPSEALTEPDAGSLRLLVQSLARRKVGTLRLVTDSTPRAAAAERLLRAAAAADHLAVRTSGRGDATLAIAGWGAARDALARIRSEPPPLYGTYLAPWLVHASIVSVTGTSPLAALPFDPQSEAVRAYVAALRRVGPGQSATSAGLAAFLAARGQAYSGEVALYAATGAITVMPMGGTPAMAHNEERGPGWLAGGALTPVSKNLAG